MNLEQYIEKVMLESNIHSDSEIVFDIGVDAKQNELHVNADSTNRIKFTVVRTSTTK